MKTATRTIARAEQKLSFFRLPILWLFVGPPALRFATDRSATASLEGSYDFWNILQVVWWLFWGAMAARDLLLASGWAGSFRRRTGSFFLWAAAWLGILFLSCAVSPAPLFSLANVTMLTVLVVAAADLGVKVYGGWLPVRRLLRLLFCVAAGLVLLIVAVAVFAPKAGSIGAINPASLRMRGGSIAYAPLLSLVLVFAGLYFYLTTRGPVRFVNALAVVCGLVVLAFGQTRSAYGGFVVGLAVFAWLWLRMESNVVRLMTGAAVVLIGICGSVLAYDVFGGAAAVYDTVGQYVVREEQTLSNLSGRTDVMAVLLEAISDQPLGLGFAAGPRQLLLSDRFVEAMHTDVFGNAHNAYLEVLAGGGYFAFIAFVAVVGIVLWRAYQVRLRTDAVPLIALLAVVLLEGVTESVLVLPFEQTSVLFWTVTATVLALHARSADLERRAARPAARPGRHAQPFSLHSQDSRS